MARLIGRTGGVSGQDFVLSDTTTLGASGDNDIRIAMEGISRRHARIVREGDHFLIEDSGATNGTFVNGFRIQRETLRHLDIVTLGRSADLIFLARENEPMPAPEVDQLIDVKLEILDGPEAGTVVDVPRGETTLGRAPSCNVVLNSPAVGRAHARIERGNKRLVLQDLQSANGTTLNGTRIEDTTVLASGDVISLGGVRSLTVRIKGTPSAQAAANVAADARPLNQEWKTRFMWGPEELAQIEAARAEAIARAQIQAQPQTAKGARGAAKRPPAGTPPDVSPKPAAAPAKRAPAPGAQPLPAVAKPPAAAAKPPVAAATAPSAAAQKAEPPAAAAPSPAAPPKPPTPAVAGPGVPPGAADQAAPAVPAAPPPAPSSPPVAKTAIPPALPTPVAKPAMPTGETPSSMLPPTAHIKPGSAKVSDDQTIRIQAPVRRIQGIRLIGPNGPVRLGLGTFKIGRAVDADVRLEDRQASRAHASLVVGAASAVIEDLKTVNGTLVNGREVKGREQLDSGDTVRFGESEFKIELITG